LVLAYIPPKKTETPPPKKPQLLAGLSKESVPLIDRDKKIPRRRIDTMIVLAG
jgi:hypothetical protein